MNVCLEQHIFSPPLRFSLRCDVSFPLYGCRLMYVRCFFSYKRFNQFFFTLLFVDKLLFSCSFDRCMEEERGVRKKAHTLVWWTKKEPEIHKQSCHWVESPSVTYKKKCVCALVRVLVCVWNFEIKWIVSRMNGVEWRTTRAWF